MAKKRNYENDEAYKNFRLEDYLPSMNRREPEAKISEPEQDTATEETALFPMQKVLYFNNLFYINDLYMYMCLSRDKLGTKIGVKNAKKNKYRH